MWLKTRPKGERFDFCCVRFGRFWPSGGVWRLIDPFCEGSVGELGAHGAGLSSYFKLIKWLFLTFSVLSVLYAPAIVINTFPNDGWSTSSFRTATWESSLSATMLGNLASSVNASVAAALGARVSQEAIAVPARFCVGGGAEGCTLRQSSVAALYAVVLALGALWVLGAHRWLAFFARLEHRLIDNVTLSADDYTVIVKDLPPNISEKSLQEFVEKKVSRHSGREAEVVEVHMAEVRLRRRL